MSNPKNRAAKIRAKTKYTAKTYDQFPVYTPKGKKASLRDHAKKRGESLNGFVNRAIDETLAGIIKRGKRKCQSYHVFSV